MRSLPLLALLLASPLLAQPSPTRCQTSSVTVSYDSNGARLLGVCDGSLPDDVLWNLDRSDQVSGVLDGHINRLNDGSGSVVYVVDSGTLAAHDEFMTASGSKVIAGVDVLFSVNPAARMPCNVPNWAIAPCANFQIGSSADGHGTSVASIVAGNRVGVAPGAKLVALRVFSFQFNLTPNILLKAFDAIIAHAFDPATPSFKTAIVTMSTSLPAVEVPQAGEPSYAQVEAKIRAMIAGVDRDGNPDPNGKRFFFTLFGGNADANHCDPNTGAPILFPQTRGTGIKGLIVVGGLAKANDFWSNSCRGPLIEILAPAADILGASFTGHDHYRPAAYSNGTSFATPYVAGIAARMLGFNPNLTPEQLEDLIEATPARSSNPASDSAGGRVAVILPPPEPVRRRAVAH